MLNREDIKIDAQVLRIQSEEIVRIVQGVPAGEFTVTLFPRVEVHCRELDIDLVGLATTKDLV
jgi:hypothetical protein